MYILIAAASLIATRAQAQSGSKAQADSQVQTDSQGQTDFSETGIGFQATLEPYPFFVSGYMEPSYKFSAALYPYTFPILSQKLDRSPKSGNATFATNSLTFKTQYYGRGRDALYLVPISADAELYLSYRKEKFVRDGFANFFASSLANPNKQKGRRGLGIRIALPERLDRIFGEGGAGLKVSGYRRITFSGRSQWSDAANTDLYRQNKFPSLNMEQISKFDIQGTIGTKITVKVSQDSQTDIPLANRIQIRYKGEDDDILKVIEAGNTTLQIPNTRFVGYSQRIRGLFGIKAEAQLGKLTLTTILSQEKGSAERTSFSASGEENANYKRDYEYARNRIFDLVYPEEVPSLFDPDAGDKVVTLYVYEQLKKSGTDYDEVADAFKAHLHVFPDRADRDSLHIAEQQKILVKQIDQVSGYEFENDPITGRPRIIFNSSRTESRSLCFYMEIRKGSTGDTIKVGDISQSIDDSLILKVLSLSRDQANPALKSWQLMWRNCYNIPRGISGEDLDLRILKGLTGTEKSNTENLSYQEEGGRTQDYLEILGLDQYNTVNQRSPDGRIDDHRSEIFRPDWGLLIFPEREPFNSDVGFAGGMTLSDKVPGIYNTSSSTQIAQGSQYYLQLSTQTRSSIIRLNKANIIEGSERVMLNGRQLKKGVDYNIQYDFGQITLLSQEALDPNADLIIDFEYAPFLSLQKKTLLGARALYEFNDNFKLGSTVLYKSDKAQERKPKVGQETARMMVLDFDASLKLQPNFLTSAANALPLVTTEVPSRLTITAEVAQSRPNPNVNGVAYIDDFETAVDHLSLGSSRTLWQQSSLPDESQLDTTIFKSGKLSWHNPNLDIERVNVEDVYARIPRQGESLLRTFRMVFQPHVENGIVSPSWAGITRYFHSRVDSKRAQLFEFRARINSGVKGKLHFDFGQISEDLQLHSDSSFANKISQAFSEDGFSTEVLAGIANGAAERHEDVGLDGLPNNMEPGYDPDILPDPNGDNWFFEGRGKCPFEPALCQEMAELGDAHPIWRDPATRYLWLNGTEGNLDDPSVEGLPDEEALSDNSFNEIDAYFSITIDMANNPFRIDSSRIGDWYTYRIPIRDSSIVGIVNPDGIEPNWEQITHVRVWFESDLIAPEPIVVEIADWYFAQSNWQDSIITHVSSDGSTEFNVSFISTEDSTFVSHPDVKPYKDPTYNVVEPQRGMALNFKSLQPLDTVMVSKELISVDKYSGYRRLKMYVYGDIDLGNEGKILMFFRLGRDVNSFYEFRRNIYQGWDDRNFVDIDFNEMTALKDSALRAGVRPNDVDIFSEDGRYHVRGSPNLNEVRFFAVGLLVDPAMRDSVPSDLSGQVWLDEMRVTDVRRDIGTAGRISANGSIADLVSYNYSFQSKDAFFRGISAATRGGSNNNLGSGQTETSFNYGITFHLDKMLPRSWGAKMPISYSVSSSTRTPLLRNRTDIVLPEEIREQERSESVSRKLSMNGIKFNHKGKNPLFKLFLNRLRNTSFSYGRTRQRSVTTPFSLGENLTMRSGFDFGIKMPPTVPLFFWTKSIPILKKMSGSRLGLYPSKWTVAGDFNRSITITDDISNKRRTTLKRGFNGTLDLGYNMFQNLSMNYRYRTVRDLADLDLIRLKLKDPKIGLELKYSQNFSATYDPKLLSFLTPKFSFHANYGEDYDKTDEANRSNLSSGWSVSGNFDHHKLFAGSSGGTERRFRGGSNLRGGGVKKDKEKKGKPFYDPPLAVFRFLTGWINPFNLKYEEGFTNRIPGVLQRPSWKYRFGMTRDIDTTSLASTNRNPSSGETVAYSASSGFILLGGIKTEVQFKRSIATDLVTQGPRYQRTSTNWPTLTIRIQKFRKLPIIKPVVNKLIDIFSPRTGFTRLEKESLNLGQGFIIDRSVSVSHSPLLSITLKLFRALSVSGSYSLVKDKSEKFNQETGEFQRETISLKKAIAGTAKYSFTSPQGISIPLIGRLKFRSTVTIELSVKFNSSLSETTSDREQYVANSDKTDLTISPRISYQFSQQIKGGVTGRWQDSSDKRRGQSNHIRELQIWTEIRF